MNFPVLIFGLLLSTLYGAGFHLWRGGGIARLFLYLILGWLGFWIGHVLAGRMGWEFASLGPLHIGMASLTAFVFLLVGYWLSLIKPERRY